MQPIELQIADMLAEISLSLTDESPHQTAYCAALMELEQGNFSYVYELLAHCLNDPGATRH